MRPIPEPFPPGLEARVGYVSDCLDHDDWESASQAIEAAFQIAEGLSRVPSDGGDE